MSLKDKAAKSAQGWSGRAKDLASRHEFVGEEPVGRVASALGKGIRVGDNHGDANLFRRIATNLQLNDDESRVTLERFVGLLVRTARELNQEHLSERDVVKVAIRRQRLIGTASASLGPMGVCLASLYSEAAILCDVERIHTMGLTSQQLSAHLLVLWGVLPDYAQAEGAVSGTGPSIASYYSRQLRRLPLGVTREKFGEMSSVDAVKLLWRARQSLGETQSRIADSMDFNHVVLRPTGRVKEVVRLCERQLGVT